MIKILKCQHVIVQPATSVRNAEHNIYKRNLFTSAAVCFHAEIISTSREFFKKVDDDLHMF